ncbi:MAG TPA: cation diffusion facilitator family transporter [Candidatus Omnitrophota bacterium]|nr:cation diffusion facilitator family transporter [Candidatus Omnitrophota bacterium]
MPESKERYMMTAALISLWFNIVLFIFKTTALVLVHSLAIAADFAITVVGLTVSIILYHSLKLSNRPADLLHNYGYGKVEHVCEAIEGAVLIGIAFILSLLAIRSFFHTSHVSYPWLGFASSVISFSLNFIGAFFLFKLAAKSQSPAVKAEAVHYKLEGFISFTIAIAFIITIFIKGTKFDIIECYIDPVATILVSVVVSVPSVKLAKQAFINLLDASIEEPSKMDIVTHLGAYADSYCNFKDLKTRQAGHKKFIEVTIILPEDMPFQKAYDVALRMENDIKQSINDSEVTVKIEPCRKDCGLMESGSPCLYL